MQLSMIACCGRGIPILAASNSQLIQRMQLKWSRQLSIIGYDLKSENRMSTNHPIILLLPLEKLN